jgi:hypothetical protein
MTATPGAVVVNRLSDSPIRKLNLWFIIRRRFPPPWPVEELDACYVVRDHDGLAYVYFGDPAQRPSRSRPTRRGGSRRILRCRDATVQ